MKNFLKSSTLCSLALVLLAAVSAQAQQQRDLALIDRQATRDSRLISAKAGGVNFVAGDVKARRAGAQDWQSISVRDDLKDGDSARTGADGRVEVLLNPGSYLRAGASTEIELTDASLDNLRLRVTRGSVLVEATGYDSIGLSIQISTPQTRVEIVRAGVYRIDVAQAGETVVSVQKGRAHVGEGAGARIVKGGKEARVAGAVGVEVAKLQKKQRDELDQWSRERGKELAKANSALANRQTNSLLASYHGISDMFRADFPNRAGFWFWNTGRNCYTFLPFSTGWRSPYGFGYGSFFDYDVYNYNCFGCPSRAYRPVVVRNANPPATYTPNTTTYGVPPPSASGGGSTGTTTGGAGARGGGVASPPPSASPAIDRGDRIPRERTIEPGSRP